VRQACTEQLVSRERLVHQARAVLPGPPVHMVELVTLVYTVDPVPQAAQVSTS